MKKEILISVCAICLCVAGLAAQNHSSSSKASFDKFVEESNKAQSSNDAKWLQANLADTYVEGTSFGTWIPKSQLIKDANDSANNKFTKSDISDVQTEVVGNVGLARFKESYDAIIEGQHRARTIICSMTAEKQGSSWKGLSMHCSKIE
ncbi:MAG: nuclear transport factor 2 family protein [Acidobacteriaceae bacterium]|nr:nuclear transport factor 2 family protein [Acidobacteriaceae bacterium]